MLAIVRRPALVLLSTLLLPAAVVRWGHEGHLMVGLAAASRLPPDMPAFFRDAKDELGWLDFEPDRMRNPALVEMNDVMQYDHFIDLEKIPDAALAARNRWAYFQALQSAGIAHPETMGFLPFRIVEGYEMLVQEFTLWRKATNAQEKHWIEQRILNEAGILGHFVADGSNPHHATIHYNGWASGTPNPEGFSTDHTIHSRFEEVYVSSHVKLDDVMARVTGPARQLNDVRADVLAYLRKSNSLVRTLYELEKKEPFSATTQSADHKAFVVERLAAGAEMLRSVWYTAWLKSATM